MLHGIMSEQEHCLYSSDSVSVRMKLLYTFSYKSIALVHNTKEFIFSTCYQIHRYLLHVL